MNELIFSFLFFLTSQLFFPQTFTGKVIGVKDGDTVEVLFADYKSQIIRLAHIDCPEKNQPFGAKAKKFVSDFCFSKQVTVVIAGKPDRNGRWIAEVFYRNQNLGKELVRNGLAWHFKKYSHNQNYAELERIARKKRMGLWHEENPVEPWKWRNTRIKKKNIVTKNPSRTERILVYRFGLSHNKFSGFGFSSVIKYGDHIYSGL